MLKHLLLACLQVLLELLLHYSLLSANIVIHNIADTTAVNASLPPVAGIVLIILSVILTLLGGIVPSKSSERRSCNSVKNRLKSLSIRLFFFRYIIKSRSEDYGKSRFNNRFLGSGKTTFIKKYAQYLIDQGYRIGIIENDFGAVNVDMMLLQDLESENCELEMVAGACDKDCHQRRFKTKLISMGMRGFDRVLVEPSGIFDVEEFLMFYMKNLLQIGMK